MAVLQKAPSLNSISNPQSTREVVNPNPTLWPMGTYVGKHPGKRCNNCVYRVSGFDHELVMDALSVVSVAMDPGSLVSAAMEPSVSAAMIQCPHEGCLSYVAHHKLDDHKIACPNGPCACEEFGCDFTGSPIALCVHLMKAHAYKVQRVFYGKPFWCLLPMPVSGSRGVMAILYGDDASAFALILTALGPSAIVSMVCIRPALCLWPPYKVKLYATGPPAQVDFSIDTLTAVIEPTSCPSPGRIMFEDLTSFLAVPPKYINCHAESAELPREVAVWISIDKKDLS